jgi:Fe-S oxidoreductase
VARRGTVGWFRRLLRQYERDPDYWRERVKIEVEERELFEARLRALAGAVSVLIASSHRFTREPDDEDKEMVWRCGHCGAVSPRGPLGDEVGDRVDDYHDEGCPLRFAARYLTVARELLDPPRILP